MLDVPVRVCLLFEFVSHDHALCTASLRRENLWAKSFRLTSQMVAVYDVVEIAGISYGMISKRLAYDLNRNHTM